MVSRHSNQGIIISIRDEFNSSNFSSTALNALMRRLSFKTQRRSSFRCRFAVLQIPEKPCGTVISQHQFLHVYLVEQLTVIEGVIIQTNNL